MVRLYLESNFIGGLTNFVGYIQICIYYYALIHQKLEFLEMCWFHELSAYNRKQSVKI